MPKYIHQYPDPEQLTEAFASYFAELVQGRSHFAVALSGGSTPKRLFRHWAAHYAESIDWSAIHFFWGDERMVPPDDPESNFGVTKELFFNKVAVPESNIHRIKGEANPEEEVLRYAEDIRSTLDQTEGELPVFDLIILGMGDDGHTASIFPHQMELLEAKEICGLATHPESGQQRISLTGPIINEAASIAFLATGAGKAEKVRQVLGKQGEWQQLPAAHITPTTGELHWFMDQAATELLRL